MNYRLLIGCILLLMGCNNDHRKETIDATLELNGYIQDRSVDAVMDTILLNVNCVIAESGYSFATTNTLVLNDKNQMIVVPFYSKSDNSSTGFSLLDDRLIFISPKRIKEFVASHSFSDSSDIKGYMSMVLIHEWGHILTKLPSGIDQPRPQTKLGEQSMSELTPQVLTKQKKDEMKIDSLAVVWLKKAAALTQPGCFDAAIDTQLAVNSAEFIIFGLRTIENFGNERKHHLIDPTNSYPNFELRLAFMNYYFNPTSQKKEMIDQYLYDRIEGALQRQETDPRIYQGLEKELPK